jgi:DNA-binding LacI/PurR family transcriptional regulator
MVDEHRHVGIREIAAAAGVSITTVSHALNGKGRLQPQTRERVRRIAEQLKYRPNATARNLVEGRTGLLGLAISPALHASDFAYYTQLMIAATRAALDHGYALVLTPSSGLGGRGGVAVDGTIIIDPISGDPLAGELYRRGVPVVTTGRALDDGALDCWVDNDHLAGARTLLEHLRKRGAERVALITSRTEMSYTVDVERAFRSWCDQHSVAPSIARLQDLTERAGFAAASELLALREPPDSIYATYDRLAHGTLLAAQAHEVRVPDDLLLVSTATESAVAPPARPSLTVLNLHPDQIGQRAAEMLVDLVEGREPAQRQVIVPTRVIARGSTRRSRRTSECNPDSGRFEPGGN